MLRDSTVKTNKKKKTQPKQQTPSRVARCRDTSRPRWISRGSLCNYIMQDGCCCCGGGAPNVSQTRPPSLSVLQRPINKSISTAPERRAIFCCHHCLVPPLIFPTVPLSLFLSPSHSLTLTCMHITHGNKARVSERGRCIFDWLRRQRFTPTAPPRRRERQNVHSDAVRGRLRPSY